MHSQQEFLVAHHHDWFVKVRSAQKNADELILIGTLDTRINVKMFYLASLTPRVNCACWFRILTFSGGFA